MHNLWPPMSNATWLPPFAAIASLICTQLALCQEAARLPDYIKALEVVRPGDDRPIEPVDHRLYSYSDSARVIADGGIWGWGAGRPVAMAKAWKNRNDSQTVAFSLTSDELVICRGPQARVWMPEKTQVEPAELRGAPAP